MNKNVLKPIFILFIYTLPICLALNLIIELKQRLFNVDKILYKNLYDIGYTKSKTNPYKNFRIKSINPHYLFGLPIEEKKRKEISNQYVSIDKNGYRKTFFSPTINKISIKNKCILILGGSTAFGSGVSSDKNTIASFLQSNLGKDYLLFNLGAPSWNSRQELISAINFISRPISQNCK